MLSHLYFPLMPMQIQYRVHGHITRIMNTFYLTIQKRMHTVIKQCLTCNEAILKIELHSSVQCLEVQSGLGTIDRSSRALGIAVEANYFHDCSTMYSLCNQFVAMYIHLARLSVAIPCFPQCRCTYVNCLIAQVWHFGCC